MRKKLLYSILLVLVFSCEEKECCVNPISEFQGRFEHQIPNCDNSENPEANCTEWLEFINDDEVDILYGGGDIVYRFDYVQKENTLHLEGEPTSSFRVSFKIIDAQTLVRTDTDDIWKKVE